MGKLSEIRELVNNCDGIIYAEEIQQILDNSDDCEEED